MDHSRNAKVASTSAILPGIFASRSFRQYYAGQTLSLIGDGLRTLAVPLLVYRLTGSALSTGISYVCEIAPFALFGLIGGSLADRVDRRALMIGCDALRCAVMALFALLFARHALSISMLYGGLVLVAICAAFFHGRTSFQHSVFGRVRKWNTSGRCTEPRRKYVEFGDADRGWSIVQYFRPVTGAHRQRGDVFAFTAFACENSNARAGKSAWRAVNDAHRRGRAAGLSCVVRRSRHARPVICEPRAQRVRIRRLFGTHSVFENRFSCERSA